MIINVYDILKSKQLWSAIDGKKFKESVIDMYLKQDEVETVEINLSNIEVADTSFIREGFVKLIVELSFNLYRPRVYFSEVSNYMIENLDTSFFKHERFAVVLYNERVKLIGKFSKQTNDTLRTLFLLKNATANMIANLLGINLNTVNNRLAKLYSMAIISRKEIGQETGGKEFEYSFTFFYFAYSSETMKEMYCG